MSHIPATGRIEELEDQLAQAEKDCEDLSAETCDLQQEVDRLRSYAVSFEQAWRIFESAFLKAAEVDTDGNFRIGGGQFGAACRVMHDALAKNPTENRGFDSRSLAEVPVKTGEGFESPDAARGAKGPDGTSVKAAAESAVGAKISEYEITPTALMRAATNCAHEINYERIVLHYDEKRPGHNALNQLTRRLCTAVGIRYEVANPISAKGDESLHAYSSKDAAIREAIEVFRGFRAGCSICDDEGRELDWRDIDRRCLVAMKALEAALEP